MRKFVSAMMAAVLILSMTACGGPKNLPPSPVTSSTDTAPPSAQGSSPEPVDPLVTAREEFDSAARRLSDLQASLQRSILEAEKLLADVTREDVVDSETIDTLEKCFEDANAVQEIELPGMESDLEKIQAQTKELQEQVSEMDAIYSALDTAISKVKSSQQALKDKKIQESVAAKKVITGIAATSNGYEAEYTISATNLMKASDVEALQLAWEGLAKEGEAMPALSSFHNQPNDGYTEANAAVLFGSISLKNVTQGFDITADSPASFYVGLGVHSGEIRDTMSIIFSASPEPAIPPKTAKILMNYSSGGVFENGARPLMENNTWGPVTFMAVLPNVFTPNDPNGDELGDVALVANRNSVVIPCSW